MSILRMSVIQTRKKSVWLERCYRLRFRKEPSWCMKCWSIVSNNCGSIMIDIDYAVLFSKLYKAIKKYDVDVKDINYFFAIHFILTNNIKYKNKSELFF